MKKPEEKILAFWNKNKTKTFAFLLVSTVVIFSIVITHKPYFKNVNKECLLYFSIDETVNIIDLPAGYGHIYYGNGTFVFGTYGCEYLNISIRAEPNCFVEYQDCFYQILVFDEITTNPFRISVTFWRIVK